MILKYIERQIKEIEEQFCLKLYGACLTTVHISAFVLWHDHLPFAFGLKGKGAVCWPYLTNCKGYLFWFESQTWEILLWCYLLLAVITIACFLFVKRKVWSWCGLFSLEVFKYFIHSHDFKMMGNHHFMAFFVAFSFLFIPQKRRVIQYLLLTFYFFAGLLKLNFEWLSGDAIPQFWSMSYAMTIWMQENLLLKLFSQSYVIFLELFLVFGLLAKNRWVYGLTLLQLFVFHTYSYFIVGFFYPAVMFALLPIFFFRSVSKPIENSFCRISKAFLTFVIVMNIVPWLIPGDSSVTGEGRWMALNMFDANTKCSHLMIARYEGRTIDLSANSFSKYGVRIGCDPYIYWERATSLCRELSSDLQFLDLDVFLQSRKKSDASFSSRIQIENFCKKNIKYKMFLRNQWIKI